MSNWQRTFARKLETQAKLGRSKEMATLLFLNEIIKKLKLRNLDDNHLEALIVQILERGNVTQEDVTMVLNQFYMLCEKHDIEIQLDSDYE